MKGGDYVYKFYRGYVRTNGKASMEPLKNRTDFKALDEVQKFDSYGGVLDDNVVLIDIDDYQQSERLMDVIEDLDIGCRVIVTSRGKHFLFKNNGKLDKARTGAKLAIGLTADIKLGSKTSYEVLKLDGVERKIIWDLKDDEELAELPMWLLPVKSNVDFNNLGNGDGRNDVFYSYILTLQSEDFTTKEAIQTIELCNEYVLKEPLDKSELDIILREESFQKDIFFKKNQFLFDKFAVYLKNNHHIIKLFGLVYVYDEGIYVNNKDSVEYAMIQHIPNLLSNKRREVYEYLKIINQYDSTLANERYIVFRNGVLDVRTEELHLHSPEFIITNKIPHDYNANAYDELTDKILNKISCDDKEIRMLLEEMVGYTMYRRNELGKAFILTGEKSNGKSTFLKMIKHMLGRINYSSLDLNELGERFKTAELNGKLANIGDDIDNEYIKDVGVFKKLVTGDTLNVERKHEGPFDMDNYAKFIFSANDIPKLGNGKGIGAIMRRMVIVPFNATFSPDDVDYKPNIIDDLTTQQATEYLIKLGVEGLQRVLKTNQFTESSKVKNEINEFEKMANPILGFIAHYEGDDNSLLDGSLDEIYIYFENYHKEVYGNDEKVMPKHEFSKQVQQQTNYITERRWVKVVGKKVTFFVKS